MMCCVGVKQLPDHALVLSMMLRGLVLKELDASLAQCNGDFDACIPKDEVFRPRKEIRNDLHGSEMFVGVSDSHSYVRLRLPASTVCAIWSATHQLKVS